MGLVNRSGKFLLVLSIPRLSLFALVGGIQRGPEVAYIAFHTFLVNWLSVRVHRCVIPHLAEIYPIANLTFYRSVKVLCDPGIYGIARVPEFIWPFHAWLLLWLGLVLSYLIDLTKIGRKGK